jgi:hypothetical protein
MRNYVMYHISLKIIQHVLSIYDSISCKFTGLHYIIPQKNMGSLFTLMGLPKFSTGLASRVYINENQPNYSTISPFDIDGNTLMQY